MNTNAFPDLLQILCYFTCTYLHFTVDSSRCLFCSLTFDDMDRNGIVFGISFGTKYLNRNSEQKTLLFAFISSWVRNTELTRHSLRHFKFIGHFDSHKYFHCSMFKAVPLLRSPNESYNQRFWIMKIASEHIRWFAWTNDLHNTFGEHTKQIDFCSDWLFSFQL